MPEHNAPLLPCEAPFMGLADDIIRTISWSDLVIEVDRSGPDDGTYLWTPSAHSQIAAQIREWMNKHCKVEVNLSASTA